MVVNEEFARTYFNDGRPVVGRRFDNILEKGKTTEIVGVVGNVLKNGLTDKPQPEFYVALGNHGALASGRDIYLVVRSNQNASDLAASLRAAAAGRRCLVAASQRGGSVGSRSRRPRAIRASRRRR